MLKIGIAGVTGRMGRMLVEEVLARESCRLTAANERTGTGFAGQDVGIAAGRAPVGLEIVDDPSALAEGCEAALDFTTPDATMALAPLLAAAGKIHVIGTTGLSDAQKNTLRDLSKTGRIVVSPNMSLGVNLLMALVEQSAALLGPEYDIEILEMHHRHKVDAPSGTALGLGEAAARGRGILLAEQSVRSRDGITGARNAGDIGFATLRGGDVVGNHTVMFASEGERIELSHKASNRQIYARGAVTAAEWAANKPPGLYTLRDVLGI